MVSFGLHKLLGVPDLLSAREHALTSLTTRPYAKLDCYTCSRTRDRGIDPLSLSLVGTLHVGSASLSNSLSDNATVWNFVGGTGFTICGAFGYSTVHWAQYQSAFSTFWGGWAFLIGSILQLYEAVNPVNGIQQSSFEDNS